MFEAGAELKGLLVSTEVVEVKEATLKSETELVGTLAADPA